MKLGFTLVELSIVLVIIGLVIGGVLVGRDLIKASEIRSQITQIEKFNIAVNTFKTKYNGLPGDLKYTEASAFGLYAVTYAPYIGYYGYGDGDGILHKANGATNVPSNVTALFGEPLIFWRHLSDSNMIDSGLGKRMNNAAEITTSIPSDYLPLAKIGTKATIQANSPGNKIHYYVLATVNSVAGAGANGTSTNSVTALEAYQIDSKIDNGLPGSGSVFAINGSNDLNSYVTWNTLSAVPGCVSAGAYAVNPGTTADCSLRFKFQ